MILELSKNCSDIECGCTLDCHKNNIASFWTRRISSKITYNLSDSVATLLQCYGTYTLVGKTDTQQLPWLVITNCKKSSEENSKRQNNRDSFLKWVFREATLWQFCLGWDLKNKKEQARKRVSGMTTKPDILVKSWQIWQHKKFLLFH